ncbi:transposase [Methanobrevibacter sp. DSM 116169]|uniref:transposase n=1 Tax=Methanobrevibacter sp. DSM 116169 TaxID=3242727 RepID=UPI0038FC43EC
MKTFDFIKFLIEIRLQNMENFINTFPLKNALNNKNIDDNHLITHLKDTQSTKEDFINTIEKQIYRTDLNKEQLTKKLQLNINKENSKNKRLLDSLKRNNLYSNINKENIIDDLKNEKRIVIILDNAKVHEAKLVEKACKILNIELIPLPPYSPKYNPIEQIWRVIKRKLSILNIKDKKSLINTFKSYYEEIIDNTTFYEKWVKKFLY